MPRKIKVSKKKVKEPDEFISTSSLIINYVKNNYRNIIPVAAVVLIVAIITVGWFYYSSKREKEAAHLFYQSKQLYNSSKNIQNNYQSVVERYRLSLGKFEDIRNEYSGTSSAIESLFYIGDCHYNLREYDKAVDNYEQFLNISRKGNYLRYFAFEGLGYCYEEKGDYEKALEHFTKSMEEGGIDIKELAYLNIARCYEALNNKAKALEFYKKLIDDQNNSIFSELVQNKVEILMN